MRIIRFLDDQNRLCYGYVEQNSDHKFASLLKGELLDELQDTGYQKQVKKLLAPLLPPAILCIGLNYYKHAKEIGMEIPTYPVLFMKNPATINNPYDPIILPPCCMEPLQVDYEVELAVIIGKSAKDVSSNDALDYVLGYTIANDVSARCWQKHAGGGQWIRSKSFDTFCPIGPVLVTTDEIPNPQALQLKCSLNDEIMQDANTSDMIFSVADIIEYLSSSTTLLPGTLILTGTPSGVGYTRKPPVYLKPGDLIKLTAEYIGTLISPIIGGK